MKTTNTKELTLMGILVALICAVAPIVIPLGIFPPITFQTLFVFLTGLLLTKEKAAIVMVAYIIIGATGLPVFAYGVGGIGVVFGATGGFILFFPIAAYLTSMIKNRKIINNEFVDLLVKLFVINLILYMFGGAYFIFITNTSLATTIGIFSVYIPGDIVKIIVAIYVSTYIRTHMTYEHS